MPRFYSLALICTAFTLASLSARADAPPLHFYNAQTGATAIGHFGKPGIDDTLHQSPNPGTFSPGWTYTVHVLDSKYLFVYNAVTGAAATAYLGSNGRYVTAKSYPAGYFTQGWTSVIALRAHGLVFYRSNDGLAAVAHVADDGSVTTGGSYTTPAPGPLVALGDPVGKGWSALAGIATQGDVFFYNRATGSAQLGAFGERFELQKAYGAFFSPGWSRIVFLLHNTALDGELVYYNATSGALAIGHLDLGGNHTTLSSLAFTRGFTSVVAMQSPWTTNPPTPSQVFFYNQSDGSGALANVTSTGNVTFHSWPAGTYSPGWTSIAFGL